MNARGEIIVDPNPATEGGTVTVTFPGPGPWYIRINGSDQDWTEVTGIDPATNSVVLDVPAPGGGGFSISDNQLPDSVNISVPVDSQGSTARLDALRSPSSPA